MSGSGLQAKGFFGALFDFSFTSFITLKFLKVIYAVIVGLIGVGGFVVLVAAMTQGAATAIAALILVPLLMLVYLVMARIYLELVALFFRIGENTSVMATSLSAGVPPTDVPPAPGYGYGYGSAPPPQS
jgi:hypothetical protein